MIIKSMLDDDLYKITMMCAVVHKFPNLKVRYRFTDRRNTKYPDGFDVLLKQEVKSMESLFLTKDEKKFLNKKCGTYLPPPFIDLLEGYRYDSNELNISLDEENHLVIEIEGYWYRTIKWEVTLMSLISELYFKTTGQVVDLQDEELNNRDKNKVNLMVEHNAFFADFGTRRRYSYENQDRIVKMFSEMGGDVFVGTSNIHLAHKYNISVVGTQAHEWIMVHAALYGYKLSNKISMENWVDVYGGQLGTVLSDTFTTDVFFKNFNLKYSKLYDGVRHDSGCPFEFTDKVVEHYKSMGIDPMSKVIIFSDGLDIETALKIKEYCIGKIKSSFGIGTHLTNDVDVNALNIVIKISQVLIDGVWVDAVKLSDNLGKNTGNVDEVHLCKRILNIPFID